ncbi:alkaline phosphatase family protein [Rhodoplanes sp. TEM]|uniref:Alkaline phosphatase family protein n=1 Tax=Rhodoplanes tepidamans TaxID=200616 RepID=A0ABT5JB10_RHOTP|nr:MULTISPECIES: alkaline phosphatase family protein [Rhodoplanes]MDC7786576.1 alkaline phosphatase family protein [Rhodoplanes tepidamans]MDC7983086.1 alkaline phosphatase family protein [Rhodoplanes sp. TEM]MDQ0357543.1 arylsulfatase A-like enzyme [Rhodoplanes tepidamans]
MRRVVLVILDGLRRDFVTAEHTPHLAEFATRAERFSGYRSAFPSATRVVSATLATGCWPARHELQGNSLALIEDGALVPHDAGHPDFLQHKRRATGRSLAVPTLAERLAPHGGAIVFNNVSPGAAYAHDPDGHGHVYHRVGAFGPGRTPLPESEQLRITLDAAGDRAMTDRFTAEVLTARRPALAVLWLGEPDHIQHGAPLGSPEHLDVLRAADRNVAAVVRAVDRLRAAGDDVLLIVGSDHGHQTVGGIVDIDAALVAAGLKESAASGDVLAISNGTSALIYVHPEHDARRPRLDAFFRTQPWAGTVLTAEELASVGQAPRHGLAFAISMKADDTPNEFGVPGTSIAAKPRDGKPDRLGCGQHGGLAAFEQSPVLMIDGQGFSPGTARPDPVRIVDVAPTVLRHLGVDHAGMDGHPLQSCAFHPKETLTCETILAS